MRKLFTKKKAALRAPIRYLHAGDAKCTTQHGDGKIYCENLSCKGECVLYVKTLRDDDGNIIAYNIGCRCLRWL